MRKTKKTLDRAEALSPLLLSIGGFFAYLFTQKNYIALGAILVAGGLIGTIFGKIMSKPKHKP